MTSSTGNYGGFSPRGGGLYSSHNFSKDMQSEFEISLLGELNLFLGIQISQLDDGIFISQTKYIMDMLNKFRMKDCKPVSTFMVTGWKLRKDDEYKEVKKRCYRSMIGSFLYVTTSRLDVMQAAGQVSRFQQLQKKHII